MKDYFTPPGGRARRQVLVRQGAGEHDYHWVTLDDGVPGRPVAGELAQLAEDIQALGSAQLILSLSADRVHLRTVEVADAELRHYRKLLPFSLEDELAEPAENLHFAYTVPREGQVGVAVVRRAELTDLVTHFADNELVLNAVVPENLLLPWQPDQQTWLLHEGEIVTHTGRYDGFKVSLALLPQLLECLPESDDGGEQRVTVLVEQQAMASRPDLEALLPESIIDWQAIDTVLALQAAGLTGKPLNLLQGEFDTSLDWRQYWRDWRPVAALGLAALLLNFGALVYNFQTQKALSLALQAEKYSLARQVLPPGRIQSPERQLLAMANQAQNSGPTRLSALLALVGPHLKGEVGYSVRSITFDGRTNILRLEVRAGNFQQIERFREAMEKKAVQAKFEYRSDRGQGILARLELSEVIQ